MSWYVGRWGHADEAKRLPAELLAELEATLARWLETKEFPPDGAPCIWYDAETKRCRHYEHRPSLCRDGVEVGDEACRKWRRAVGVDPQNVYTLKGGRLEVLRP